MSLGKSIGWLAAGVAGLSVACSIAIQRDLSRVPPGQVGFDDMCGLQEYFDAIEIHTTKPPRVVSGVDLEGHSGGKSIRGGRERFAFDNDFLLGHARRVLMQNWRRLPPEVEHAKSIEIEVRWSEKAGAKRVVTDEPAELGVGSDSWELPYHVCLSELLYGEPLYRQRRAMWGLPLPGQTATKPADGGTPDGATPDAGAVRDASAAADRKPGG